MLDDPHAEVRIAVLQALVGRPFQPALGRLEEMIQDKDLESRDLGEKRVLFEAFGVLAGPSGTARLKTLIRGRAGLGRRGPSSDTRACAAVALGMIGTPPAREALETALRDRDPVVRTAAARALRREDRVS
jgi:HEAT repeat protein